MLKPSKLDFSDVPLCCWFQVSHWDMPVGYPAGRGWQQPQRTVAADMGMYPSPLVIYLVIGLRTMVIHMWFMMLMPTDLKPVRSDVYDPWWSMMSFFVLCISIPQILFTENFQQSYTAAKA